MTFLSITFCESFVRLVLVSAVLSASSLLVVGQTGKPGGVKNPSSETPATPVNPSASRTDIDETFELNIDERHYSRENFEAATAVGINSAADNVNLQVGVALTSGRIDLLLRNVHGSVRFRGTLGRILDIINNRQPPSPNAPSASPSATPPD